MIKINIFPKTEEEKELVYFVYQFQYLDVNDVPYFFESKTYYKKRIANLVKGDILRRYKLNLVLGELGKEYIELQGHKCHKLIYDKRYLPRLKYISHLAAFYHKNENINFIPSFIMKDKEKFTITSRRFIGILKIDGVEYLTYYISKEHKNSYLYSIIYDIQKEREFRNIIVLVNDINRINLNDFMFGMNQVLIIEDSEANLEKLKYLHKINWNKLLKTLYPNQVYLSEYNFCDYINKKSHYISVFYFLDTEKINRIRNFISTNQGKVTDIICDEQLHSILQKELVTTNLKIISLEPYIEKSIKIYD